MFYPATFAEAAYDLGYRGILCDPSDADILIAAAELMNSDADLSRLSLSAREAICAAYDRGADYRAAGITCSNGA